jgi:hypothetical protein
MLTNEFFSNIQEKGFSKAENIFSPSDLDSCEHLLTSLIDSKSFFVDRLRGEMSADASARQQIEFGFLFKIRTCQMGPCNL